MASPENDTVMFALILLGAITVMLAVALLQRLREIHRLRELGERVQAVAESGDLAERLTPHAGEGSAGEIAGGVDRLIERLQVESSTREERESVYRRLLETMTEAMLVERDGIQLANARFAELAGVANPGSSAATWPTSSIPTTPNSSPNTCAVMPPVKPRPRGSRSNCRRMPRAGRTVSSSVSRARCWIAALP
jgi:PAS domain-containing protein